jgi:hypothetical protein
MAEKNVRKKMRVVKILKLRKRTALAERVRPTGEIDVMYNSVAYRPVARQ